MPAGADERKTWINNLVCEVLNKIDLDVTGKILFIDQGRHQGRDIPMVEVRLDSKKAAFRIRNKFVSKKKRGSQLRIWVWSSVWFWWCWFWSGHKISKETKLI